jgi:hypothetical protein
MKKNGLLLSFLLCVAPLAGLPANSPNSASWRFEVAFNKSLTTPASPTFSSGRVATRKVL